MLKWQREIRDNLDSAPRPNPSTTTGESKADLKGELMIFTYDHPNIIKCFIIGKNTTYFKNQLTKKIQYKISFSLTNAIKDVFKELLYIKNNKITVLFSPASASYDQYNNFVDRGNEFKKVTKDYAKKFL
jgi:UDP-N-acetylmuramoylalanine--D-glutamate ligase